MSNGQTQLTDVFGMNVFNDAVMRQRLPKNIYGGCYPRVRGGQSRAVTWIPAPSIPASPPARGQASVVHRHQNTGDRRPRRALHQMQDETVHEVI